MVKQNNDGSSQTLARVPADLVRQQIESVFTAWGMSEAMAAAAAHVMTETDLRGIDSHGLNTLPLYQQMIDRGAMKPAAEWKIVRQSAATALIDAGGGLGHPVSVAATELAIEKAQAHDIGVVCVINSHHFGAAGHYAELAAKAGMIAMVTTSTRGVSMVPTGGTAAVLGTNPFAFASPAGKFPPLVLDFATTTAAVNKIKVYGLTGRPLPQGWVSDSEGNPVTDAQAAVDLLTQRAGGGLHPFGGAGTVMGGHKGYGLALFSHILGGTLPGGSFAPERLKGQKPGDPDEIGHFFLVLNPAAFRPFEDYQSDLEIVIDTLKAVPPMDPEHPVLVAGEPENITRADRQAHGIPINQGLRDLVREIAEKAAVPYLLG